MKKKKPESSASGKQAKWKGKYIPDSEIDFSDIPELTDEQLKSMRRVSQVGRPPAGPIAKVMIAIRMDPYLLGAIRIEAEKKGVGYQTLINTVLENHFSKKRIKKAG